MADIKISALPTATTPLTGAELVPVVQGGVTKQTTATAIFTAGVLPVVNGGTGTATPALVPGSNVTITGTWPNQTINSTSSATVTSVSVVSANGLAGTVANATTTPAITLSTSVTGIVKGNGTTLSAASAGTDYVAPGGALGTPSSGTVTNLTGTASININGTVGATTPAAGTFTSLNTGQLAGLRNRIINGAMTIDQRNNGASVTVNTANNFYPVDRLACTGQVTDGVFTVQQSTIAPSGFKYSILATVTTADASIGATQQYLIQQLIEGYNVADLGWGAAGASTVTVSFWVRSSLTGTFGGSIVNSGFNRSYPFTFTISSANTWEKKSITIAGDTSGTWLTDNSVGMRVIFSFGAGSTYAGTAGAWAGAYYAGATGQTQVISTNAATFYITGVQLELGSTATPFEQRPYGMELALCQRYYYKIANTSANRYYSGSVSAASATRIISSVFTVASQLRVSPTITYSGIDIYNSSYSSVGAITSASVYAGGTFQTPSLDINLASGLTTGSQYIVTIAPTTGYMDFSAEL